MGPGVTDSFAIGDWSGVVAIPNGPGAEAIPVPRARVATLIGITTFWPGVVTNRVLPSGVIVSFCGCAPAASGMAAPAVRVAMVMGVMLLPLLLATNSVVPSGVIAIPFGLSPT